MSIVRIGMSEDDKFGDGYEAIFGKKTGGGKSEKPAAKKTAAKKKPVAKKPAKKKS